MPANDPFESDPCEISTRCLSLGCVLLVTPLKKLGVVTDGVTCKCPIEALDASHTCSILIMRRIILTVKDTEMNKKQETSAFGGNIVKAKMSFSSSANTTATEELYL